MFEQSRCGSEAHPPADGSKENERVDLLRGSTVMARSKQTVFFSNVCGQGSDLDDLPSVRRRFLDAMPILEVATRTAGSGPDLHNRHRGQKRRRKHRTSPESEPCPPIYELLAGSGRSPSSTFSRDRPIALLYTPETSKVCRGAQFWGHRPGSAETCELGQASQQLISLPDAAQVFGEHPQRADSRIARCTKRERARASSSSSSSSAALVSGGHLGESSNQSGVGSEPIPIGDHLQEAGPGMGGGSGYPFTRHVWWALVSSE